MNAHEHYRAGDLAQAITAGTAEVKAEPTNLEARGFLSELFCFAGDWDRADRQLDAMGMQEPEWVVPLALVRQLIRGEMDRREVLEQGRAPLTIDGGEAAVSVVLNALLDLREGRTAEASASLAEAAEATGRLQGKFNGEPFEGIRDLDDVFATVLEIFTSTGEYYLVPLASVESIQFEAPARPHHLLWRQATVETRGGPSGAVFLPARYAVAESDEDALLLVRATDWRNDGEGPVRGAGLRTFLIGEQDVPMLQMESLEIAGPA